jgi:hypothetical protein
MTARNVALIGVIIFAGGCADRPLGPAIESEGPPEVVVVPASGSHLTQQFLITPVALDFGQVVVGQTSAEQHVLVTNVGHDAVEMSGTGGAAGEFGGAQDCQGITLAAGSSCTMTYRFTPTTAGAAEVTTGGTWNGQPFSLTMRGEGVQSERFSITGTSFDFGQVNVGDTSPVQVVTVTNRGPGAVTMSGAGGAAGVFGGSQNCQGITLAEGASCQMFYEFTPTAAGVVTGTTSGTWNGQSFSLSFRGEGMQRERFAITPAAFDFGEVNVGGFSSLEIVNVTNIGPGPVVMSGTGGAAAGFGGFQNCEGMSLGEGASCQMFYYFMPSEVGVVTATASGTWNGQSYSVDLRGEAIPAGQPLSRRFLIATTGFDFGQVEVGSSSAPQTVTITNLGPGPVTMSGAGGAAGVFGGSQNCQGVVLQEGQSCQMMYQFTPTTGGEVTTTTSGSWNGQPFSIAFRGFGVQRDRFLITPVAHDFGSVDIGATSAQHVVRVTNLGPGIVTMSGAGGAAGEFGGSQNCQGVALVEGAWCEMFYAFTPTEAGEIVRTTSGTWNGQPFELTFRGVGVQRDRFLITPTGLDFGEVVLGNSSAQQVVTVTNLGPDAVTMSGAGGAAGLFGGSQNCQGVTLAQGASCQMFYQFTPDALGTVTATTSGSWNGQDFDLEFRGTAVAPVTTITFGGFLPPINRRPMIKPGSTIPVKGRLLAASGEILGDAEAEALASACAVTVTFTAMPGTTACARYELADRHFQAELKVPRLVPTGAHRITMDVRIDGRVVASSTAEVLVR